MKSVLLLAYYFPPRVATGSLRPTYLAKYLPRFGWDVTVVTPRFFDGQPPLWAKVLETGYTDVVERAKQSLGVSKDISAHGLLGSTQPKAGSRMTIKQRFVEMSYKVLTFPDPQIGWFKHGVPAVAQLLCNGSYDALLSTSYPYTSHLIARKALAGKKTPWLADLRDAWRGNHYAGRVRSTLDAMLERTTLSRANAVTTVSAPLARLVASNNPHTHIFEIRNAFDPDDWVNVPFKRTNKFTLTYAGSLLQGFRDPEPLLDALLKEFTEGEIRRDCVEMIFYVKAEKWLDEAIVRRGLQDVVTVKGYVERDEVLVAERATTANLLLLRDHPGETGVYTGKLFEYLGAGRPIIAVGGPMQSVVRDLLERVGGWYVRSAEEIRLALRTLYQRHYSGSDVRLQENIVAEFSAVTMAERFANVLNNTKAD